MTGVCFGQDGHFYRTKIVTDEGGTEHEVPDVDTGRLEHVAGEEWVDATPDTVPHNDKMPSTAVAIEVSE